MLSIEDIESQKKSMRKGLIDALEHLQEGRFHKLVATCSVTLCIAVWLRFAEATDNETAAMSKLIDDINRIEPLPSGTNAYEGATIGRRDDGAVHKIGNPNFAKTVCRIDKDDACIFSRRMGQAGSPSCLKGTASGSIIREKALLSERQNDYCSGPPQFKEFA